MRAAGHRELSEAAANHRRASRIACYAVCRSRSRDTVMDYRRHQPGEMEELVTDPTMIEIAINLCRKVWALRRGDYEMQTPKLIDEA